ncbi:Protein of unknown function, partial [Gryllus bimaculatus]
MRILPSGHTCLGRHAPRTWPLSNSSSCRSTNSWQSRGPWPRHGPADERVVGQVAREVGLRQRRARRRRRQRHNAQRREVKHLAERLGPVCGRARAARSTSTRRWLRGRRSAVATCGRRFRRRHAKLRVPTRPNARPGAPGAKSPVAQRLSAAREPLPSRVTNRRPAGPRPGFPSFEQAPDVSWDAMLLGLASHQPADFSRSESDFWTHTRSSSRLQKPSEITLKFQQCANASSDSRNSNKNLPLEFLPFIWRLREFSCARGNFGNGATSLPNSLLRLEPTASSDVLQRSKSPQHTWALHAPQSQHLLGSRDVASSAEMSTFLPPCRSLSQGTMRHVRDVIGRRPQSLHLRLGRAPKQP